jgi:DNA repair exonuclease SbcCD ATPase subunit
MGALIAQNESLTATLQDRESTIAKQDETLKRYEAKLADAKTVLSDKEQLESQIVKQMDMINKQTEALATVKDLLSDRDAALATCQYENGELQLRASTTKQHCIIFDGPWILETTHHRLKGSLPQDREGQTLQALQGEPGWGARMPVSQPCHL